MVLAVPALFGLMIAFPAYSRVNNSISGEDILYIHNILAEGDVRPVPPDRVANLL